MWLSASRGRWGENDNFRLAVYMRLSVAIGAMTLPHDKRAALGGFAINNSPGFCIWFTGRSGGGKSTLTKALVPSLQARGYTVSVLDVIPLFKKNWSERSSR
jgi:energy-coupling factor transporter ATP-binding protein EcfA2